MHYLHYNNYNNNNHLIIVLLITSAILVLIIPSQTISFTTATLPTSHPLYSSSSISSLSSKISDDQANNSDSNNNEAVCISTDSMTTTTATTTDSNNNNMSTATTAAAIKTTFRTVQKVLERPSSHWVGDGFHVLPVFGSKAFTNDISPLLMFDYGPPKQFPPKPHSTKPAGVGQHPHRGFETVTIAFQGEVEHHDNAGNTGIIYPGDVQWMTAGRGIVHEEYHSKNFTKNGGMFEMCQLWVNLPKKYKMTKPRYQAITNEQIPVVNLPLVSIDTTTEETKQETVVGGTARIIAGEIGDTKGAAKTFSPIQVWDITIPKKDSIIDLPIPTNHQAMIFVRRGSIEIITDDTSSSGKKMYNQTLQNQDVGILRYDGSTTIRFRTNNNDCSILLLGGEPLNEPIAAQGPFVMNTRDEIRQAMIDYQTGKF